MTVVAYNYSEELASSNSTGWTTMVTAVGSLPEGKYVLQVSCEYSGGSTTKACAIRVLLDGVEVNADEHTPVVAGQSHTYCNFGLVDLPEGSHSLSLQFRTTDASATAYCRRARLLVTKF